MNLKIKKGDRVKVISGRDRDKSGKVLRVFRDSARLVIEGVNIHVKHIRPRREGEKGQKVEFPASIAFANVLLVCPKCDKAMRVTKIKLQDGRFARRCRKCGEMIDKTAAT